MIVRSHRIGSLKLLVAYQGSIIPAISNKIFLGAGIGFLATIIRRGKLGDHTDAYTQFEFLPFTALGVAISLFLGFYNNASYGRWWEARTLWGTQITYVRGLVRFLLGTLEGGAGCDDGGPSDEESRAAASPEALAAARERNWRAHIAVLAIAQTHALRLQLRPHCDSDADTDASGDRDRFLTVTEKQHVDASRNPANAINLLSGRILGYARSRGDVDAYSAVEVSRIIDNVCAIQTACERLHNTSLPLAYSLLMHRTSTLFVLLAPFGMAEAMGWWTPVFNAIIAYTLFGLDELARQIQEPFRDEPNCLALSAMSRTVEIDVLEALGISPPPYLKPIKSVLM